MKKEIKLNVAISILVILVVSIATLIELVSSTNALKTSLTNNYLENNYNYTNKLAEGIQYVTSDLQQSLVAMAKFSRSPYFDQDQLDILFESEYKHFNSLVITDKSGHIQLMSPKSTDFENRDTISLVQESTKINRRIVDLTLSKKQPFISEPYITDSGILLILFTAPIIGEDGTVEGMIAGTIYLESENAIDSLFGSNTYIDGSYVYAVDQNGRIIYHPDADKIFENVSENPIVEKVISGESGSKVTVDKEKEYFAGYSYIENLGWGVILHTPATILEKPLYKLVGKIIAQYILILVIILMIATFLVKRLTNPLTQLAQYSERLMTNNKLDNPNDGLTIHSSIYEINQLYRQLRIQLLKLNQEIQLDGLTGVANRKAFDTVINEWTEQRQPFALAMLDIDNFKNINDSYGHLVGDDVIKFLASILNSFSRVEEDLCFRYGGEEFGLLLKDMNEQEASAVMEQFRTKMANMQCPAGKPITVSVGVTSLQTIDETPKDIIERADKALYQSKQAGKNRVTVYYDDGK